MFRLYRNVSIISKDRMILRACVVTIFHENEWTGNKINIYTYYMSWYFHEFSVSSFVRVCIPVLKPRCKICLMLYRSSGTGLMEKEVKWFKESVWLFYINMWVCNCASREGKGRVHSSWERKRQRDSPLDQREEETTQGPDYCSCWDLRVRQTFGNGVSMLSETFYGGYPPYHITILLLALLQWEVGSRMTPLPLFWEQEV